MASWVRRRADERREAADAGPAARRSFTAAPSHESLPTRPSPATRAAAVAARLDDWRMMPPACIAAAFPTIAADAAGGRKVHATTRSEAAVLLASVRDEVAGPRRPRALPCSSSSQIQTRPHLLRRLCRNRNRTSGMLERPKLGSHTLRAGTTPHPIASGPHELSVDPTSPSTPGMASDALDELLLGLLLGGALAPRGGAARERGRASRLAGPVRAGAGQ
jgi:hypothetical protein